jgi:hypothetical protein
MAALPDEYRHEPALALASGDHGLDAILHILAHAPAHLEPGGVLVAEVGNSHVALSERFPDVPFVWLTSASGDESVFLLTGETWPPPPEPPPRHTRRDHRRDMQMTAARECWGASATICCRPQNLLSKSLRTLHPDCWAKWLWQANIENSKQTYGIRTRYEC